MLRTKGAQMLEAAETLASLDGAGLAQGAIIAPAVEPVRKAKRKGSASTRAKMKAAHQARWKRVNAERLKRNLKLVKKA